MASPAVQREVAATTLDFLLIELVAQLAAAHSTASTSQLKLEAIGFSVGQKLAERQTTARTPFADTLDAIKYVCKEFWMDTFLKQVDNLRTNHRGVFVLTDNRVRWLATLSPSARAARDGAHARSEALVFAHFPCGLIRGALAAFGIEASVSAEVSALPACQFTVKVVQPAAGASTVAAAGVAHGRAGAPP
ncbi:hypothetical protein KFE25_001084 [Diacronema lutheri]|uniref:Trafficking protein particle complex subunit 6B n=1 Tax=Diacronema lutheri TaxID=2081491 RepID=A0A8J6C9D6_DIALT|nr:hypothetical protein KFE25_001084 [Diacronema lutheri]